LMVARVSAKNWSSEYVVSIDMGPPFAAPPDDSRPGQLARNGPAEAGGPRP
jgi:hypothetical protein